MKFPSLIFISIFVFFLTGCETENPTDLPIEQEIPKEDPKEEETPKPETYFTLNVDANYNNAILNSGYIIIHDANGELLDFKEYAPGTNLIFESEEGDTVSDKITITQFSHTDFGGNEDYYAINTFPLIDKGATWDFFRGINTFNPNGKFDVRLNDVPDWKYYNLSNKHGHGVRGSSFYKYFNNPEDAEPFIAIEKTDHFNENDFILSVVDENSDLKYADILDVQQNDSIVLNNSELTFFDSYLEVALPDYDRFFHSVQGYETDQDFDADGLILNESTDYTFTEKVDSIQLGYLSRFSRFRTFVNYNKGDYYQYRLKLYGPEPNEVVIPAEGSLMITDSTLTGFKFETDLSFQRQRSTWSTMRTFGSVDYSSTFWIVYAPNANDITVYNIPEEITQQYSNLDIDLLRHESTELFLQSDSYDSYLKRRWKETKIGSDYIEESMQFGKIR